MLVIYSSTTILIYNRNHDVPRDVKDVFVIPARITTLQLSGDAIMLTQQEGIHHRGEGLEFTRSPPTANRLCARPGSQSAGGGRVGSSGGLMADWA